MDVYLIYQEVPENTLVYFLGDVSSETYAKLRQMHGKYINSSRDVSNELSDWFSSYLFNKKPFYDDNKSLTPIWNIDRPSTIIMTGFIL